MGVTGAWQGRGMSVAGAWHGCGRGAAARGTARGTWLVQLDPDVPVPVHPFVEPRRVEVGPLRQIATDCDRLRQIATDCRQVATDCRWKRVVEYRLQSADEIG